MKRGTLRLVQMSGDDDDLSGATTDRPGAKAVKKQGPKSLPLLDRCHGEVVDHASSTAGVVPGWSCHQASDGKATRSCARSDGLEKTKVVVVETGAEVSPLSLDGVRGWAPELRLVGGVGSPAFSSDPEQMLEVVCVRPLDSRHAIQHVTTYPAHRWSLGMRPSARRSACLRPYDDRLLRLARERPPTLT